MMNAVETVELTKIFKSLVKRDEVKALESVSLKVKAGEVFGLLGPNGAGKTTLVKILLGITFPTRGSAFIFGENVSSVKVKERIGYLPEAHKYPGYLSGERVLDLFGKLSGVDSTARRRRIDALLRKVKMDEWRKMKLKKYSKGMMQRLGLAQALLNDPDMLFLDEPTDGVDPIGRVEIRDILLEEKRRGKTIFINSHLLSEVELMCDHVAVLDKGHLITHGSIEELTRGAQEYKIAVDRFSDHMASEMAERVTGFKMSSADGHPGPASAVGSTDLFISVRDVAHLNEIIDWLRGNGVCIGAIVPLRRSLEELFIHLIKRTEN